MEFLLGPITQRINVMYESRMKWTCHHSKLAVEEVSFFGRLRVVLSSGCLGGFGVDGEYR